MAQRYLPGQNRQARQGSGDNSAHEQVARRLQFITVYIFIINQSISRPLPQAIPLTRSPVSLLPLTPPSNM